MRMTSRSHFGLVVCYLLRPNFGSRCRTSNVSYGHSDIAPRSGSGPRQALVSSPNVAYISIALSERSAESVVCLEFIRKLLRLGGSPQKAPAQEARGAAPVQSQEEQDATRSRMEAEVAEQREKREATSEEETKEQ